MHTLVCVFCALQEAGRGFLPQPRERPLGDGINQGRSEATRRTRSGGGAQRRPSTHEVGGGSGGGPRRRTKISTGKNGKPSGPARRRSRSSVALRVPPRLPCHFGPFCRAGAGLSMTGGSINARGAMGADVSGRAGAGVRGLPAGLFPLWAL